MRLRASAEARISAPLPPQDRPMAKAFAQTQSLAQTQFLAPSRSLPAAGAR
jgi:hypothetical protein